MIAQGAHWQHFREQLLKAIPVGAASDVRQPQRLGHWIRNGTFSVTAATARSYTLNAHPMDFGGVLLAEAECYLDHAAEHQVSLFNTVSRNDWFSPAWLLVTVYYWAFYSALAATRLLGDSVWFVDQPTAKCLSALAPKAGSAGSGTFQFQCLEPETASARSIVLQKSSGRIHEQLWRSWFDHVASALATGRSGGLDERCLQAQHLLARNLSREWPSTVRNIVNYVPGLAYDAVRGSCTLSSFRIHNSTGTANTVVDEIEMCAARSRKGAVENQLCVAANAMTATAFQCISSPRRCIKRSSDVVVRIDDGFRNVPITESSRV